MRLTVDNLTADQQFIVWTVYLARKWKRVKQKPDTERRVETHAERDLCVNQRDSLVTLRKNDIRGMKSDYRPEGGGCTCRQRECKEEVVLPICLFSSDRKPNDLTSEIGSGTKQMT